MVNERPCKQEIMPFFALCGLVGGAIIGGILDLRNIPLLLAIIMPMFIMIAIALWIEEVLYRRDVVEYKRTHPNDTNW